MIKAIRGTRDLLPPETALWNHVEAVVREVFRAYNFHEIRTPIFESTELFARGVGEETDIVAKEMYTFPDRGDDPQTMLEQSWLAISGPKYSRINLRFPRGFKQKVFEAIARDGATELVVAALRPTVPLALALRRASTEWNFEHMELAVLEPPTRVIVVPSAEEGDAKSRFPGFRIVGVQMPQEYERPEFLTLRPEATAGIVRAYIEHKLEARGLNKLYCIGPMFRRERPQKGRYRQFYQIDAEVIGPPSSGSDSPARDAEILELLARLLDRLGIKNWNLQLNSVGCAADRARYDEALRRALEPVKDKMCEDCQRRAVTNPLRVFDCKVPEDQPIIEKLPRISEYLDEPCRQHFAQVQAILKSVDVEFQINSRLVRGLDYYTRTAFEFTHGALGAQNAILGGGRYDGLSESLGGPPAPGIGFAIGEDRLVLALSESAEAVQPRPDVYIAPLGAGMNAAAARLARELRRQNIIVELGDENFRLKKSLETASKLGTRFALIVGENEVSSGAFALKNLATSEQISVPRAELANRIQSGR